MSAKLTKEVIEENSNVLYGIFNFISSTDYFPPHEFLNEFLEHGSDPCDQDGRMSSWPPFVLSESEYTEVKDWWLSNHPNVSVSNLGTNSWIDWQTELIEADD